MGLAQFIVLTGAQAAGKNTIAKAIYYFSLPKEIIDELLLSSGGTRSRSAMQNLDYATQKYVREVLLLRKFFSEGTMKHIERARQVHNSNA